MAIICLNLSEFQHNAFLVMIRLNLSNNNAMPAIEYKKENTNAEIFSLLHRLKDKLMVIACFSECT